MNELTRVFLVLITLALLTACTSNPRVQSSHSDNLDFGVYDTYNFSSLTEFENPDLSENLQIFFSAAVEQQMAFRGLAKSDNPDLLINVVVNLEDVSAAPVRANNCPRYDDYNSRRVADAYDGEGRRPMCKYAEGKIEIDIIDVNPSRTIWKGVSRVRIDDRDRGARLVRSVVDDVARMFADSPSRHVTVTPNPIHPYNPASASRGSMPTVSRPGG